MGITRIRVVNRSQANKIKGQTDVRKMTDEEIHRAALSDPDAQPLTEYQLSQFRPFMFLKNKLRL